MPDQNQERAGATRMFNLIMIDSIGYAAALCTTVAFLPQAYVAIKHRDTRSLSLAMYIIFTLGVSLWLIYGLIKNDWALIAANSITVLLAMLILISKLRNDIFIDRG
ncbi:MAG TPA: SemiSWEET transporter [Spongiibacteraceae bacterium]|jgi:MtN3 and saliva related transmembrane protein